MKPNVAVSVGVGMGKGGVRGLVPLENATGGAGMAAVSGLVSAPL